ALVKSTSKSSLLTTSVSAFTLVPVYTASVVSKSLPAVDMNTSFVEGAVHWNQTDRGPVPPAWSGSPVSLVAPTLVPDTLPTVPLMTCALVKLSLAGATSGP